MAKYKNGMYHNGPFRGGSNEDLSLITCDYNIVIPSIHQSYVLYWFRTYLLHPVMDGMEAMIYQYL